LIKNVIQSTILNKIKSRMIRDIKHKTAQRGVKTYRQGFNLSTNKIIYFH
jgi:hypothetical protein